MAFNAGEIFVTLKLRDELTKQMQVATANLAKNINKSIGGGIIDTKSMKADSDSFGVFMKRIDAGVLGAQDQFNNLSQTSEKSLNAMGNSVNNASNKMAVGWSGVFKQMFNLKQFVGQVVHYITFSIGVQMVMAIQRGITQIIDIFRTYEKTIVNAAAVTGYLGKSFDIAKEQIDVMTKELASKTIFTATEVAEAMYSVASAGINPLTTSVEELIPILQYAQATQTNLARATEDLLTVLFQFQLQVKDLGAVTDVFTSLISKSFLTADKLADAFNQTGQVAGELNQDIIEVASSIALLSDRGYEGSAAGQRLNMIFTQLLDPTEESKKAIAALGLRLSDLDPTTNSVIDIFKRLNKANYTAADAAKMFRARTAGAMITLVSSVDAIEEYVAASKEASGITEMIATRQMQTLEGHIKSLEDGFQQLAITLGSTVTSQINTMIDVFSGLQDVMDNLKLPSGFLDSLGQLNTLLKPLLMFKDIFTFIKAGITGPAKAIKDWAIQIGNFQSIMKEFSGEGLTEKTRFGMGDMGILGKYKTALDDVINIRMKLTEYVTEESKATEEYQDLILQLSGAEMELANAESKVISTSGKILDVFINQNAGVAQIVAQYNDYKNAASKRTQIDSQIVSYSDKLIKLEGELATATNIYGANSEEVNSILNQYTSTTKLLDSAKNDLVTQTTNEDKAEEAYLELLNALPPQLRAVADSATSLIDLRGSLFRAQEDYNGALFEYNRLLDLQKNKEKYLSEAYKNLYDAQDKLWEIESKRYQLKEDEEEKGDELFDALAEQGLLTDDIIQQYTEWQEAEGELMDARAKYAKGEITEEELAEYIEKARKEYEDYAGVGEDVNGVAIDYAQHLVDIGAASNDVADTLYDIYDISNDDEQTMQDWEDAIAAVNDALDNIEDIKLEVDATDLQSDIDAAKLKIDELKTKLDTAFLNLQAYKIPFEATTNLDDISAKFTSILTLSEDEKKAIINDINDILSVAKGEIFGKFFTWFLNPFGVTEKILAVMDTINKTTVGALKNIWAFLVAAPANLIGTVYSITQAIWKSITGAVKNMWDFMFSDSTNIVKTVQNIANSIWNGILSIIPGWVKAALGLLGITLPGAAATPANNNTGSGGTSNSGSGSSGGTGGTNPFNPIANAYKVASITPTDSATGYVVSTSGKKLPWAPNLNQDLRSLKRGDPLTWATGGITKGPQFSMIGEKGPEAVIPLQGMNKKYGEELLNYIIPRYYPDLLKLQAGGIVGGRSITYGGDNVDNENYTITGPINITGIQNVDEFGEKLRFRMRSSK